MRASVHPPATGCKTLVRVHRHPTDQYTTCPRMLVFGWGVLVNQYDSSISHGDNMYVLYQAGHTALG
jgi:hypothetical protein